MSGLYPIVLFILIIYLQSNAKKNTIIRIRSDGLREGERRGPSRGGGGGITETRRRNRARIELEISSVTSLLASERNANSRPFCTHTC